jgi:hypothetical protein
VTRTIVDWLARAAAGEPGAFDAAIAQADSCTDWQTILAHLPRGDARAAAVVAATLTSARAERQVCGFRRAAEASADPAAARDALDAAFETFSLPDPGGRPLDSIVQAEGYLETLDDRAAAERCLRRALDAARDTNDASGLAKVAVAWATHVDRTDGIALLREAEQGGARRFTLAIAWRELGLADEGRRVLDATLAKATTFDDAIEVAHASASFDESARLEAALETARRLAATATEWLKIAERAFESEMDRDLIAAALHEAERCATPSERPRIAAGFEFWAKDPVAAARVGPRGVRPDDGAPPASVHVAPWSPSRAPLFDRLRARIGETTLQRIAIADYGSKSNQHLAALRDIVGTGLVPRPLDWAPREVLELRRWAEGESVDHVERAFCAAVLLIETPYDVESNGAILLDSVIDLGGEFLADATRFFAALLDEDDDPSEAILLLILAQAMHDPHDPRLGPLVDSLSVADAVSEDLFTRGLRAALWRDLVDRILVPLIGEPWAARLLEILGR